MALPTILAGRPQRRHARHHRRDRRRDGDGRRRVSAPSSSSSGPPSTPPACSPRSSCSASSPPAPTPSSSSGSAAPRSSSLSTEGRNPVINRRTFLAGATTAFALAATGCATSTATTPSTSPTGCSEPRHADDRPHLHSQRPVQPVLRRRDRREVHRGRREADPASPRGLRRPVHRARRGGGAVRDRRWRRVAAGPLRRAATRRRLRLLPELPGGHHRAGRLGHHHARRPQGALDRGTRQVRRELVRTAGRPADRRAHRRPTSPSRRSATPSRRP